MRRLCTELPFTCVTCGIEIAGTPEFYVGLPFCCGGCVAGGPCICSYDRPGVHEARVAGWAAVAPSAVVEAQAASEAKAAPEAEAAREAKAAPEAEEALVLSGR